MMCSRFLILDGYDINRAIHVRSSCFAQAAIDCGSDFKIEGREDSRDSSAACSVICFSSVMNQVT